MKVYLIGFSAYVDECDLNEEQRDMSYRQVCICCGFLRAQAVRMYLVD